MSGRQGEAASAASYARSGVFFGAVALVLEGVGLKTCSPPMPQRQKKLKIEHTVLKDMWEWGWGARELGSWQLAGGELGSWALGSWELWSWEAGSWGAGKLGDVELEAGELGARGWGAGSWGHGSWELGSWDLRSG